MGKRNRLLERGGLRRERSSLARSADPNPEGVRIAPPPQNPKETENDT